MENTAKNFALQLGSLISLYISLGSLIALIFAVINMAYPDAVDDYWRVENAAETIRFSIAMLIVFFPTYLVLTRLVNTVRRKESAGAYLTLTKWLIYLSLLIGGAVLLGDLVAVIHAFLNGEIAIRFILKALALFVIVGAAFLYYLLDARGHWQTHEKESIQYGGIATAIVIAVLVVGFFHTETPTEVREARIDDQQIQDLSDMQWRIEDYLSINDAPPSSLEEVYQGLPIPEASEGRASYEYTVTEDGFELCAEFAGDSRKGSEFSLARPIALEGDRGIKNPYNWDHASGWWCFKRVVE